MSLIDDIFSIILVYLVPTQVCASLLDVVPYGLSLALLLFYTFPFFLLLSLVGRLVGPTFLLFLRRGSSQSSSLRHELPPYWRGTRYNHLFLCTSIGRLVLILQGWSIMYLIGRRSP